jgi:hypothetical protein
MRAGDDCQLQLKLMGFRYHHKFIPYDGVKFDESKATKEGWYSNEWSVPLLTGRFQEAINGGWFKPNSKWLIDEIASLERKARPGKKSKVEHESGKFDDRFRGCAQAYFTAHSLDILAARSTERYSAPSDKKPTITYAESTVRQIPVGEFAFGGSRQEAQEQEIPTTAVFKDSNNFCGSVLRR